MYNICIYINYNIFMFHILYHISKFTVMFNEFYIFIYYWHENFFSEIDRKLYNFFTRSPYIVYNFRIRDKNIMK